MTSLKAWLIVCCVLSAIEFSVGDKETQNIKESDYSDISGSGEVKRRELVSALQKGEIPTVKRLIEEGDLEQYYHGVHDKKETLKKIKEKLDVLSTLLQLQVVSIANDSNVPIHTPEGQHFNVTLIPGTDLWVRVVINMTALKDESIAKEGNAPLHHICSLPDVEPEIVKTFIDFGTVGINTWDKNHYATALISAVINGNLELVKFLVSNGADINNSILVDINGRRNHQFDFMNIFTRKPIFISEINVTISAVLAAAYQNKPEILRYFLENGGNLNIKESWFILFRPANKGHAEVVEILLKNGIDVNSKGPFGMTTLHRVAETGNIEMAKLLLTNGADSNSTNDFGWTALHVATLFGAKSDKSFIELLLDSGCDVNALTDGGFSPLNLAEAGSNLSFVEYLVNNSEALKFDKHRKQKLGEFEQRAGHAETLRLLLNRGAAMDNQDDILGWTTLHWAAANGDLEVVKLLVEEYGAAITLKSKMGMTPLRTAKHFGRESISYYFNTGGNLVE